MSDFQFKDEFWVLEFDHLQTGLFVDAATLREIKSAKDLNMTFLWLTDIYGVDFMMDPTKLYLGHLSTPATRLLYRRHNAAMTAEKKDLGPWDENDD